MTLRVSRVICVAMALVFFSAGGLVAGSSPGEGLPGTGAMATNPERNPAELSMVGRERLTAVIYPFRSATVGSEVRGVVETIKFKEGDEAKKGDVVAEVSKSRYADILGEFKGNYDAICETLEKAKKELEVQEDLFKKRATTYYDLVKARYDVKILQGRKIEAESKLKQAQWNLSRCVIRAPFSGYIAVLYRDPFETVEYLEKVFEIVDTHKVYARVNWPEARLTEVALGKRAIFSYKGKSYEGTVDKIATLIDPASKSKRVHVLIDNSSGELQVGMSGTLRLVDSKEGK